MSDPIPINKNEYADGDTLSLERGKVYEHLGYFNRNRLTIRAIGDPMKPKPVIRIPEGKIGFGISKTTSFARVEGIRFEGDWGAEGIRSLSGGSSFIVLDCDFGNCGMVFDARSEGRFENVSVFGCRVNGSSGQGIFAHSIDFLQVANCQINQCGWRPGHPDDRNNKDHGIYATAECGPILVENCNFRDNSASDIQARSGGTLRNIAARSINFGWFTGSGARPGHRVSGRIENVRLHGFNDMAPWSLKIGNTERLIIRGLCASEEVHLSGTVNDLLEGLEFVDIRNSYLLGQLTLWKKADGNDYLNLARIERRSQIGPVVDKFDTCGNVIEWI